MQMPTFTTSVNFKPVCVNFTARGRRHDLVVNALDFGSSGPGSSPGRGHCVVSLGKTQWNPAITKCHGTEKNVVIAGPSL